MVEKEPTVGLIEEWASWFIDLCLLPIAALGLLDDGAK